MERPLRSELSKKTPGIGKRGSYNPACDVCRRRKSKCDGIEPICHRCRSSGREMECTWNRVHARKHRSVQIVDNAHTVTEKLRNLLTEYRNYADLLESLLAQCPNTHHSHFGVDFRVSRSIDRDNLISSSIHLENADFDFTLMTEENEASDESDDPTKEIRLQTQRLMLEEGGSIHHYGITAPFRFKRFDPSLQPSRFPVITQNPQANYVLIVDDACEKFYDPNLDWSRYLPSEVPLDRMSHDKALDLLFKFFTSFCLRIIPDLFLRDMYRELSVPLSQERPKTSHYSPMLHNALAALALTFLDDPKFRDLKTRQYYIDKAKGFMEAECQHPSISVVQALSFLGSFYASQGEQVLGFLYFGQSTRVAQALGLNIDCSDAVKLGIIEESDRVDRNWTNWTTFANDVCWSLYLGRPFGISLPDPDFPMPYVDTELDRMPWKYDSSNFSPQPNYFTKTFEATCELFIIARCIMDVIDLLNKANARPRLIHDQIHNLDMRLKRWRSSLASELNITSKSRSAATPHNLCLHLSYWWLVILLHRPFHRKACSISKTGEDIGHPKLCRHSAENIMDLLATWQKLYGLRYCPITLIQIAFSAGTVYLLIAIQACSGVRVAQKELRYSLDKQRVVMQHLTEIGRSWPGATKIAEILMRLTQDQLMPLLERRKIHVRNDEIFQGAQLGDESMFSLPLSSSQCSEDSVQLRRRTQNKGKQPLTLHTPIIPGNSTGISPAEDFTSPISTPPAVPITVPRKSTSLEPSSPSSFVYIRGASTDTIASPSPTTSPGVSSKYNSPNPSRSFDWSHWRGSPPPEDYYDVAGLHMDFQQAGSSRSFDSGQDFQATPSPKGASSLGSPAFGGFAGILGGQTMTPAPFWDPFSTEDGSVMGDTAYTAMPSSSTPSLPLFKQPDHETDDSPMYSTTSEAASVGVDTDACMYDLAQWVNLVSQEFS